jgi:hypothetical protein
VDQLPLCEPPGGRAGIARRGRQALDFGFYP